MHRFLYAIVLSNLLFVCCRGGREAAVLQSQPAQLPAPQALPAPQVQPLAVLQAGEHPLWFQFSDEGPVQIGTIEDAQYSRALIPWPLAPHMRFMLARSNELLMAVNGGGFLRFAPWRGQLSAGHIAGIGLYRFWGGEFWRPYTIAAFALIDDKPAALLYRDDWFVDSPVPLPSPRLWTFDLSSAVPQALAMPALDSFPAEEGWDIDALRRSSAGDWYFRAVKKGGEGPEIRMLHSSDLVADGEAVSLGAFQNTAQGESFLAAPTPLQEMLAEIGEWGRGASGGWSITVISPEFHHTPSFIESREGTAVFGYYSSEPGIDSARLLAAQPQGDAVYAAMAGAPSIYRFSLPPLGEGFVYTGIALLGDTIIAGWEEHEGYSIGAAGFMLVLLPPPLR